MLIIIIPTYQAGKPLERLLGQLSASLSKPSVIVSDGGSTDDTLETAARHGARLACGAKGRGAQLRLGADLAIRAGQPDDWFLFLHADSRLCDGWQEAVSEAMQSPPPRYFRFRADATGLFARVMNRMVALRCWALGLPYGDQGLLVSRATYETVGGYADMPLFEDVELVERLKKTASLRPMALPLITDVSRHKQQGLVKRGLSNLHLLWRYKTGTDVETLLREYRS